MKATIDRCRPSPGIETTGDRLPHDLRADVRRGGRAGLLVSLSLAAVEFAAESRRRQGATARLAVCPDSFEVPMTLLLYCYASGIYGSREIEWMARRDPAVRYIRSTADLTWHDLRAFRRNYSELIISSLAYLLALVAKVEEVGMPVFVGCELPFASSLAWDGDPLRGPWVEEATRRVRQAIAMDSAELDQ